MPSYTEQVAVLHYLIVSTNYYPDLWERVMLSHGITGMGIKQELYAESHLNAGLFDFWAALPDSVEIRREPFFLLCDLMEQDDGSD